MLKTINLCPGVFASVVVKQENSDRGYVPAAIKEDYGQDDAITQIGKLRLKKLEKYEVPINITLKKK